MGLVGGGWWVPPCTDRFAEAGLDALGVPLLLPGVGRRNLGGHGLRDGLGNRRERKSRVAGRRAVRV